MIQPRMPLARLTLAVALACPLGVAAGGQTDPSPRLEDLPEPPPPPAVQSGEVLEPEVTIIQREDAEVEEYRLNGRLYMIKVKPVVGPAYYLMDDDGDGRLESRFDGLSAPVVPRWVLFSW